MPQTETVSGRRSRRRPSPCCSSTRPTGCSPSSGSRRQQTFDRLLKLITDMNKLIDGYAPEEFKGKWKVSVEDGSVCIGSACEEVGDIQAR